MTMQGKYYGYLILTIIIGVLWWLWQRHFDLMHLHLFIKSYGSLAMLVFVGCFLLSSLLLLPVACMAFLGGYIFGFEVGIWLNLLGAVSGAITAFILGRCIRHTNKLELISAINNIEQLDWRFIALYQLLPMVPFEILNYVMGSSKLRIAEYSWATTLFLIPAVVTYTYLGQMGFALFTIEPSFLAIKLMFGMLGILVIIVLPQKLKYNLLRA